MGTVLKALFGALLFKGHLSRGTLGEGGVGYFSECTFWGLLFGEHL